MIKKNIYQITLNSNNNFGNKLQHYALQTILMNYSKKCSTIYVYSRKKIIVCFKNIYSFFRSKRYRKFYFFDKKIKYSRVYFEETDKKIHKEKDGSIIVVGSDQVWNPYNDSFSIAYLLSGFSNSKKISYAASYGINKVPKEYYSFYNKYLSDFDYISVRENVAVDLTSSITNRKDIYLVLDPTLLLSKTDWLKIAKKPRKMCRSKYILCYFLGNDDRLGFINNYALRNSYKVINLLDEKSDYYSIGPQEFLYLEKNASLICTDSFHSCVFSLIFNVPFVVFDRIDTNVSMSSRIDSFLKTFNLESCRYSDKKDFSKYFLCDYRNSLKILNNKKRDSFLFLSKALK